VAAGELGLELGVLALQGGEVGFLSYRAVSHPYLPAGNGMVSS
jgi:hypothetical protein